MENNSAFVNDNDLINIYFSFIKDKTNPNKLYIAENEEKLKEIVSNESVDWAKIQNCRVDFRFPSFADSNTITENSVTLVDGKVQVNVAIVRSIKMSTLLAAWTLKDDKGEPVPCNIVNLKKLHPLIAGYLGDQLDAATSYE